MRKREPRGSRGQGKLQQSVHESSVAIGIALIGWFREPELTIPFSWLTLAPIRNSKSGKNMSKTLSLSLLLLALALPRG